jgi:hypothetical protein
MWQDRAMGIRTRLAFVCVAVLSLVGGGTVAAHAMASPFPTCVRDCSPVEIDTTGPCYGVVLGSNRSLDNFCYLGPPAPQ